MQKSRLLELVENRPGQICPAELGEHPHAQVASHQHAVGAAAVRQPRRFKEDPVQTAGAHDFFLSSPVGKPARSNIRP
jgi:hypothetical protein